MRQPRRFALSASAVSITLIGLFLLLMVVRLYPAANPDPIWPRGSVR